jgi:hypothetical protein
MDSKRESSSESRVHEELLRAHLETGFSLAHVAELALENEEAADFARAVAEARSAVSQAKRILPSIAPDAAEDYRSEMALLEFELHDLETRGS